MRSGIGRKFHVSFCEAMLVRMWKKIDCIVIHVAATSILELWKNKLECTSKDVCSIFKVFSSCFNVTVPTSFQSYSTL